MISRRDWLRINAGAGLALGLNPLSLQALQTGTVRTRTIPSSGVQIPVIAHPAVTVAAPGTGDPLHMVDNLGGGVGRLPSKDHLRRMLKLVESLPGG